MFLEVLSFNQSQTKKIGIALAKEILEKQKGFRVLCLQGELGSGKTTFLQGFAKGLGIIEKVLSPTFLIIKRFPLKEKNFKSFYHIDCYRIRKTKELIDLGIKKTINNKENIVAFEWPELIVKELPEKFVLINFKYKGHNKRKIIIEWKKRQKR